MFQVVFSGDSPESVTFCFLKVKISGTHPEDVIFEIYRDRRTIKLFCYLKYFTILVVYIDLLLDVLYTLLIRLEDKRWEDYFSRG